MESPENWWDVFSSDRSLSPWFDAECHCRKVECCFRRTKNDADRLKFVSGVRSKPGYRRRRRTERISAEQRANKVTAVTDEDRLEESTSRRHGRPRTPTLTFIAPMTLSSSVSNLAFISKVIERIAAKQLTNYLWEMWPSSTTAITVYRHHHHSTETAL